MEIKNMEEFVKPLLKSGESFVSYECKKLLGTGENYGSIMLRVEIKILNEKSEEEVIHCVAKTCPPQGFLWEVFNTKVTFKKEIAIYHQIVPSLNDFGREKGIECLIDFVPNCIGARLSINSDSDEVDEDAVILLENLMVQGYRNGDRFVGFDLDTSKLFLRDLATLHASVIAYKSAKPEAFNSKILPYLSKHREIEGENQLLNGSVKVMMEAISSNPACLPIILKIKKMLAKHTQTTAKNPPKVNELFATLTHNDAWVNNTLIKFENNKAVKNKMVDFQIIEHTSLANDVLFFLYTSVELSVLQNNVDNLLKFYYEAFLETLSKLGSDTALYTYEAMTEEFSVIAKNIQFLHIVMFLLPIMTLRGTVKELADIQITDILPNKQSIHENYYKKIQFVVLDFNKRGWL